MKGEQVPRDKSIVPALMFHSVGLENHPWEWSYISEPLETFEAKIALLRTQGFRGIFWHDLYEYMAGDRKLPENSILLTFDDGYLDNWVHVYPVLKKHGMKGTIFVSPDFVEPTGAVRPNLDDVEAGRCSRDELSVAGFLSWAEMREMEKSGVIDIQSHAMTHTWYFSGPKIVDFHRPHEITPYPWLFWNARPDRKPFYLQEDQQEYLPWGYPILEHAKSLTVRRFFPEEAAMSAITAFVAERGGREFFRRPDWQSELESGVATLLGGGVLSGRYESDEAREARITEELQRSKLLIERNLDKQVEFICWPGGANDESVQRRARAVGFKAWTLSSTSQLGKRNVPGADPTSIKRMGTSNRVEVRGRHCGIAGPRYQLWRVLEHQGSGFHRAGLRAWKLAALAMSAGGSK
jgi:peptidoglycan/xylan/chitin deacetylase (PgdA/CDA1 family)